MLETIALAEDELAEDVGAEFEATSLDVDRDAKLKAQGHCARRGRQRRGRDHVTCELCANIGYEQSYWRVPVALQGRRSRHVLACAILGSLVGQRCGWPAARAGRRDPWISCWSALRLLARRQCNPGDPASQMERSSPCR